eukprot:5413935-Pleurochrysis_carterae.AAC.3
MAFVQAGQRVPLCGAVRTLVVRARASIVAGAAAAARGRPARAEAQGRRLAVLRHLRGARRLLHRGEQRLRVRAASACVRHLKRVFSSGSSVRVLN